MERKKMKKREIKPYIIKTYNLSLTSEVGKNKKRESFLYNVPKNEESLPIFELAGIHFFYLQEDDLFTCSIWLSIHLHSDHPILSLS